MGYRMEKNLIGLYKENIFMNNNIYFLNREWRTRYYLIHCEDNFWIVCLSYFLDPDICGF